MALKKPGRYRRRAGTCDKCILYNILKGLNTLVVVYLDTKHYGLEPCSGRATLAIKNCKDCMGRVGLSFHWDAFSIEGMVEEKTVSVDFGGAAGPRLLTPSTTARPAC